MQIFNKTKAVISQFVLSIISEYLMWYSYSLNSFDVYSFRQGLNLIHYFILLNIALIQMNFIFL